MIPKGVRDSRKVKDIGANFSMTCFDPRKEAGNLAEYLLARAGDEAVVILWDEDLGEIPDHYLTACFVVKVQFTEYPKTNYKNYFSGKLTKIIKTFASFIEIISDGSNEQVMLLPFRNFKAEQLASLKTVCAFQNNDPDFINTVNSLVVDLKKRKRPHRRSNYPDLHYFDDDEKMFSYGLEKHAVLATGDPHSSRCVLMGNYRFGRKIPVDRHFNLSKECGKGTQISGSFFGCHGEDVIMTSRTHINIFSNDYIA